MDLGWEESHLLFLPDLCLCCNIHILVGIMWLSQSWLGAQVGAWTPCDYVRSRAERTSPAFELHRFWLSFTRYSSFPSQVLRGARILREKKQANRLRKLRFRAGFCGARGCSSLSRTVSSVLKKKNLSTSRQTRKNYWIFFPIDAVSLFLLLFRSGMSRVCLQDRWILVFLLVGRRTFSLLF